MMELRKTKHDPFIMLKLGIIVLFVGLGLGIGFLFQQWTGYQVQYGTGGDRWTDHQVRRMDGILDCYNDGLEFVTAFLVTRKLKNGNNNL